MSEMADWAFEISDSKPTSLSDEALLVTSIQLEFISHVL